MASIFLSNAPYLLNERYGKLASLGADLPNLGLLMIASTLRKAGHNVRIFDAIAQGTGYEQSLKEIKIFKPDIIGFTAVTPTIIKTAELASFIKNIYPSIPIIIGGPHFSAVPEQTLLNHSVFDYGIIGEGEETIIDLVETLSAGRIPENVPGIALRVEGKVRITSRRPPIKELDSLPFPAWDLLDGFPDIYHPALFKYKKLPSTHIISARGCPNKCIFCDNSVFGHKTRFHSSEYVLEMIEFLINRFKIKEIIFEDDQFLLKKDRVAKICEGILNAKWDISWCCSSRINSANDLALLKMMKRSGCWQISYGIESTDQTILNFAEKSITIEQISKALSLTKKAGILSKGYFILGLPYETETSMKETIEFAKQSPLSDISVFTLTPFPGSRIYEIASQYGVMEYDLEKMNLLNVMFVPKGLTKENLLHYQKKFMKEFYLRPRIVGNYIKRFMMSPSEFLKLFKAFAGFTKFVFFK